MSYHGALGELDRFIFWLKVALVLNAVCVVSALITIAFLLRLVSRS